MGFPFVFVQWLALGKVTGLYRHAVKGLSADSLEQVTLTPASTFPDDRRFALLKTTKKKFDPSNPEWLHKENFLCVFTDPHLMARYRASYAVAEDMKMLTLTDRESETTVLGPINLATEKGRQSLAAFFSEQSGLPLECVTAGDESHQHQFGNTSSGWKQKQDTRTIHFVNESTVKALQEKIRQVDGEYADLVLDPTRFRPNIILKGDVEPFSEFQWVGKKLQCGPSVQMEVLSKTVRCRGVSVDPFDPTKELDIPGLLAKHFPEHGPYLGIYAVVDNGGLLSIGDEIFLL